MSHYRKDFYVIHWTGEENIESMLKEGKLYANKYLDKKYIRLWGPDYPTRSEYIYTNLHFCPELYPLMGGITLIFDPKIVYETPCVFNKGWMTEPTKESIYIYTTDNTKEVNNKLELMKQQIIEKTQFKTNEMYVFKNQVSHELLFIGRIILDGYLIAIVCYGEELKGKLKGLVKNYKRPVQIIDNFNCNLVL